jgi:tripartite-type tricarboxylate transporter receptor subunit TctC
MHLRVLLVAVALGLVSSAHADESYPNRPIRIVLPFAAGGGTDAIARIIAQKVSQQIGVPVIIENKSGANGNIGAEIVAKAPADGYTLLYNTSFIATNPALYSNLTYDPAQDFTPIILIAKIPLVLLTNPSVPAGNLKDFVAYVKANPNKLSYASSGVGGSTHLASLLILRANGLSAVHVPYRGGGPALLDLLSGVVQFYADTANTALAFIRDGKVKALAVTSLQRIPELPDVPTIAESLSSEFEVVSWQGLVAPAKTPKLIVEKLNGEFQRALGDPEVRQRLIAQTAVPIGSTVEEYRTYLRKETTMWKKLIEEADIKID